MRNKINIVVIVMFLMIPFIFLFNMNTQEDAISSIDNRKLASSPFDGNFLFDDDFTKRFDIYLEDRIGYREDLICYNSRIDYYIFAKSPSPKVIIGNNGFLFYNGEEDGSGISMSEYFGGDRYTITELEMMAAALVETEEYLNSRGCEFVLFIAPNKSRVYADSMPEILKKARVSEECQTDQVVAYLKDNTDLHVVYPYEELKDYIKRHPDEPTYYFSDTHWNDLGAYIGTRALLNELGIVIPPPEETVHNMNDGSSGDLYNMTALGKYPGIKDITWEFAEYPDSDMEVIVEQGVGDIKYTNRGKDKRKLFVNRDSFGWSMRDFLGAEFDEVYLMHAAMYRPEVIEEFNPDIYVYELVERYDNNLLNPMLVPMDAFNKKNNE